MARWVRLCAVQEAPAPGEVREAESAERMLCVVNIQGELRVLRNECPHREGPLGQGWVEGQTVVCPWHAWAFDTRTGVAESPERAQVRVFPVLIRDGEVMVEMD